MSKLVMALLVSLSAALAQNTVDGQITVGGKTTKFTNVYAIFTEGFFDKEKSDTVVVLSSGPIAEAQLRDDFSLRKLARDGKVQYLKETLNTTGQIINFTIGHSGFKMLPSGSSTDHVFEGKVDGKTVQGRVYTKNPQKSFDDVKYDYSVKFTSNILPRK